jgi:hypothetical protein
MHHVQLHDYDKIEAVEPLIDGTYLISKNVTLPYVVL